MNGAPGPPPGSWIDHAARLVTTVGFPVVCAGLLLWFVLDRFARDVSVIADQLNANATAVQQLRLIEQDELAELRKQTAYLERLGRWHPSRVEPAEPP